jgi:hypothetical protein
MEDKNHNIRYQWNKDTMHKEKMYVYTYSHLKRMK